MTIEEAKAELVRIRDVRIANANDAYAAACRRLDGVVADVVAGYARAGDHSISTQSVREIIAGIYGEFRTQDVRRRGGWTGSADGRLVTSILRRLVQEGSLVRSGGERGCKGFVYRKANGTKPEAAK